MTSTLEIPQEMDFDPANVTAVLEGANGNFKIKDTKVQGRKVTVTLTTANENITAFTEIQKALANTDDNLKVTLSGVKFNNSSKANTNYTVKGSVGGHFTAQATHNLTGNTIKFNLTFKGEQNQAGQDFILASQPNNKDIQFTLKYLETPNTKPHINDNKLPNTGNGGDMPMIATSLVLFICSAALVMVARRKEA